MPPFDLAAYLARLGLRDVPRTPRGLAALQEAQLRALPFENLDPFLGVVPDLTPEAVFRKTVLGGRGGYCFELNHLLGAALAALGFPARRTLARVRSGGGEGGPRSHLAWLVEAGGRRWLADAGFGGPGPLVPLALDEREPQAAPNGTYRLVDDARTGERVLLRREGEGWLALFGFDEAHVGDADVVGANWLCATWPEAPFRDHLLLAGHRGETLVGAFDRAVTERSPAGERRSELASRTDLERLLADLGLTVDPATVDRAWARLLARVIHEP